MVLGSSKWLKISCENTHLCILKLASPLTICSCVRKDYSMTLILISCKCVYTITAHRPQIYFKAIHLVHAHPMSTIFGVSAVPIK